MNIYKITFVNNEPVSCTLTLLSVSFAGDRTVQHNKNHLIHALVKADNQAAAMKIGEDIAEKFKENYA